MKRMIVLLFSTLPLLFLHGDSSKDWELICKVEQIIDSSLTNISKMGKIGTEIVYGEEGGSIFYKTELTGFNRVLNTVEYRSYAKEGMIISGSISNATDWSGTGTSLSLFEIGGTEPFRLEIHMEVIRKEKSSGYYRLYREGRDMVELMYSAPE